MGEIQWERCRDYSNQHHKLSIQWNCIKE